jgi:hypothetical protein
MAWQPGSRCERNLNLAKVKEKEMKVFNRILGIAVLLSLLMGNSVLANRGRLPEADEDTTEMMLEEEMMMAYTGKAGASISGIAGVGGVMMKGLPGNPVTDEYGRYRATVRFSWSGTVTPSKQGFTFTPPSRVYDRVIGDYYEEDYEASPMKWTISGNVGLPGVVMKGLPGNPLSDPSGSYSASIAYGWTGTVEPAKEGYVFDPPARIYAQVAASQEDQDYTARMLTFTISGNAGLPGVQMQGLPGNPITDATGCYKAAVDYGWSGKVTPEKAGHAFVPPAKQYHKVTENQENQNYAAEAVLVTISGAIVIGGAPIGGVRVSANNGGSSDTTDAHGRYSVKVPYGWSGELTVSKEGFVFQPPSKLYTNVIADIEEDALGPSGRRPTRLSDVPLLGRAGRRKVLVVPTGETGLQDLGTMREDMYVMAHIFDKKFREPRLIRGVFVDYGDFFGRDARETESIYIQGYGVLFLMEVNFSLSPAVGIQESLAAESEKPVDTAWERARREVFSPGAVDRSRKPDASGMSNAEKAEELKRGIIEALKHAANIRSLRPSEWIIVTVIGAAPLSYGGVGRSDLGLRPNLNPFVQGVKWSGTVAPPEGGQDASGVVGVDGFGNYVGYGGMELGTGMVGGFGQMGPSSAAVLTVSVKKSTVDDFAKGVVDAEEFRRQVQVFTY